MSIAALPRMIDSLRRYLPGHLHDDGRGRPRDSRRCATARDALDLECLDRGELVVTAKIALRASDEDRRQRCATVIFAARGPATTRRCRAATATIGQTSDALESHVDIIPAGS